MDNESSEWYGFWIGPQPTLSLCVTYEQPIGNAEDGWHRFLLEAAAPGFRANFRFESQLGEFEAFAKQVEAMDRTLSGSAAFRSTEENVGIEGSMDRFGHVFWKIKLRSQDGDSAELAFDIEEDQTLLTNVHAKIDDMLDHVSRGIQELQ